MSTANLRVVPTRQTQGLGAAAASYATHGIPVFPCKPQAKEPLTPHGFKDATVDLTRIAAWWKEWPDANIGMPTGARTGLLVLDIDPRNGGDDSLDELRAKHGPLPDTAEQMTGGWRTAHHLPASRRRYGAEGSGSGDRLKGRRWLHRGGSVNSSERESVQVGRDRGSESPSQSRHVPGVAP